MARGHGTRGSYQTNPKIKEQTTEEREEEGQQMKKADLGEWCNFAQTNR